MHVKILSPSASRLNCWTADPNLGSLHQLLYPDLAVNSICVIKHVARSAFTPTCH